MEREIMIKIEHEGQGGKRKIHYVKGKKEKDERKR